MREKLQENTACFFRSVFLAFSVGMVLVSLAVCCVAMLYDGTVSIWQTLSYAVCYGAFVSVFYRVGCGKKWTLPVLLALCFLLRLFAVIGISLEPFSDFRLYHAMAVSFAKGEICFPEYGALFPHTVGFSAVLSILYRTVGASPLFAQICNVILETITAYLFYRISLELFDRKTGHLAVFLYTFSPSLLFYSEILATEILFTLLFAVLLYLAVLFYKKDSLWYAAAFGIGAACSHAVRPYGILLLAVFFLCVLIILPKRRRMVTVALVLICFLISRCGIYHALSYLNGQLIAKAPVGYSLYVGSNSSSLGKWNSADYRHAMKLIYEERLSSDEVHSRLKREGITRYVQNGFLSNAVLMVQKFAILWGSDMMVCDYLSRAPDFSKIANVLGIKNMTNGFHLLLAAAIFAGAISLVCQKRRDGVLYICIFVTGLAWVHLAVEVQERYSYIAWAAMLPIAAFGIRFLFCERGKSTCSSDFGKISTR